jgi:Methylase involved in ubiquinone/menaquinone biosynthesis
VLSNDAFGALELSKVFAMKQNAMSHHLKLLSNANLISSRREGTHLFYRRNWPQDEHRVLAAAILQATDKLLLPPQVRERLDDIRRLRAEKSREFFRANADKFRQQQDLIASFPQYGEAVLAMLDGEPDYDRKSVLEVGPGEGELLPGLYQRFDHVIALDNSAEMLARAKKIASDNNLNSVEFVLGDTSSPDIATINVDVITLNMVLHHTPTPSAIIRDLAGHLNPGGLLLVTELCHHDQDWAREACGDLWLGFEPEELSYWAEQASLVDAGSEFLALKNGFTIQLRQFRQPEKIAGLRTSKGNTP